MSKTLTDDVADYFVNVAKDAECNVSVSDSTPSSEGGSCDVLPPSTTSQSVISVQLRHSAMIVFGRLRVHEPCDDDNDDDTLYLSVVNDADVTLTHTVRKHTFYITRR